MKQSLDLNVSFADAEVCDYVREADALTVSVKTWNDRKLKVLFRDAIGVYDRGVSDISDFYEETDHTGFFNEVVQRAYVQIPDPIPYRLCYFLDLDEQPAMEVVARLIEVRCDD